MARIKFLVDTSLKQSIAQSSELPASQKQLIARGTLLVLKSFEPEAQGHIQIILKDNVFQELKPWFVFADHVSIFDREPTVIVNDERSDERSLPQDVALKVKHFNQLDNKFAPTGTCNITCCAMVLDYFKVPQRKPRMSYEDELSLFIENNGLDRHVHDHLARLMQEYGLQDRFTVTATWKEIQHHLANGNPVICPGDYTRSGHIIVLSGYNTKGFTVQDPNGEIFWSPGSDPFYEHNSTEAPHRGANLNYSYNLMNTLAGPNGKVWAHFPQR